MLKGNYHFFPILAEPCGQHPMEVSACFQEKIIIGKLHFQSLSIFPSKITEQNSTHYKPKLTIISKEGIAHTMLYFPIGFA